MAISTVVETKAPRSERLSLGTKVAYAIGDLGNSVGPGTIIPFWFYYFLIHIPKLDPTLASLSILIGKIWDAINDPLVGILSDRTRTRWGRRRPYLLFGAVPYGITFALLWIVPPLQSQILLCLYFALMYMLFDTAYTFVGCPYEALVPELTLDHDERTSLITYRMFVSIAGGILAAVLGALVFYSLPEDQKAMAFALVGLICGVIFIPPVFITFLGTRERKEFQVAQAPRPLEGLRYVLRNRAWRYTLAMRLLSWMPVDIASALFPLFLIYWIGMEEFDSYLVLLVILLSAILFLPFVAWLSRRMEKKWAFIVATASWVVVQLSILLVPQGAKVLAYIIAALAGLGVSSAHVLPTAMSPDVLEVDELMSGRRQEGIYAGFNVFVRKLSTGLVLSLIGPLLSLSGFVKPTEAVPIPVQPNSAQQAIRLLIAALPAVLLIASIFVAWAYPITRQRHAELKAELERRRAETSVEQAFEPAEQQTGKSAPHFAPGTRLKEGPK